MTTNSIILATLLGISNFLNINNLTPPTQSTWKVLVPWSDHGSGAIFEAENADLAHECALRPKAFLLFPSVIHGAHEVFFDDQMVLITSLLYPLFWSLLNQNSTEHSEVIVFLFLNSPFFIKRNYK
jgi:hypothetical protein